MPADRYDLVLSTVSGAARDAYVQGCELALTFYPGAIEAFDRAIAADPNFSLSHAAKAQVLMREGDVAAARAALVTAKELVTGLSEREASHIAYFELAFGGQTDAAIDALYTHLAAWPRDALVLATAANPNGLIGASGRIGQKHQIAALMDSLAPHYGDDYWFLAHHAMALSEDGQLAAARPKIERSVAINPNNAHGAHGFAHVCYESGEVDTAHAYLSSWLATYPRDGFFHGHLSWLCRSAKSRPAIGPTLGRFIRTPWCSTGTAAGRNRECRMGQRFCGVPNSPDIRATPPLGAHCTNMRPARCHHPAAGSPTCTSSWRRPSWATTPGSLPAAAEWKPWRARGATRQALTCRRCHAASQRSSAGIFARRSRRLPRSPPKASALAAAARSTT